MGKPGVLQFMEMNAESKMNVQLHNNNTSKIKKQKQTKSWLFEKINKMDKPLSRLFKRKRKKRLK